MSIDQLLNTTGRDLSVYFNAELVLSATVVLLLLFRLFSIDRFIPGSFVALVGALIAGGFSVQQVINIEDGTSVVFFAGMLKHDLFTVYFRIFLCLFLILTIALTVLTGIPDSEDSPDFYTLLIGSTIGMMMMASANHLLMLFLGVEMASVPSYVMVGFLKGRRESSEAALKYVVYGAGAAGVMLYGISLIMGVLGTGDMAVLGSQLSALGGGLESPGVMTVALGALLVLTGLAFKLSLVPFHFWAPDAFEGAPAEVAGFLSVASKAGAFALLVRFILSLSGAETAELMTWFGLGLGLIGIVTATYGNLTAYGQTNVKRLFAYSTIAHAGYMVMAVSAFVVMHNSDIATPDDISNSLSSLLFYLAAYLFMNLGAFAVVAMVRNHTFREDLTSLKGVGTQGNWVGICMAICVASLIGIPGTGGFFGKLVVFASVYKAADVSSFMYVVLAFAGANTVFSLFYYVKILKAMYLEEREPGIQPVQVPTAERLYLALLGVMVIITGILPNQLAVIAKDAGQSILAGIGG